VDLNIDVETDENGLAVLAVRGAIDLQSRGAVVEACRAAITANPLGLVLNLENVDFMDSTGIGALVEVSGCAADAGVDFAIHNPSERVVRILEITGLGDAWGLHQSAPEA
jgi:anti-sigma B factor antagonist